MQLSEHFTLEEATHSDTAIAKGINNQPDNNRLSNMRVAAIKLEEVRKLLNNSIHVDSWLRTPELNTAVGGVGHSAHQDGYAIDFICPSFGTPQDIFDAISHAGIKFDQLIVENKTWVHISFDPKMRNERLIATMINGKMQYTKST